MKIIKSFIFTILPLVVLAGAAFSAHAESNASTVYNKVKDSIITLYSIDDSNNEKTALGGAVAIDSSTLATNCHVALAGNFLVAKVGDKTYLATLLYYKQKSDLCLIEVSGVTLHPVTLRKSKSVAIGEEVYAIGNPDGHMKTISKGIISNKTIINGNEILQTDASISHGSSGGGLFDANGNLIGITTWVDPNGENIGFAIPTELIYAAFEPPSNTANEIAPTEQPAYTSTVSTNDTTPTLKQLGSYGSDQVALFQWKDQCSIGIVGRYKNKPTSLALWIPSKNNGFFIFSRVVTAEKAMLFLDDLNSTPSHDVTESKSYLYFDENLYRLDIISLNGKKQPVYVFALNKNITQSLLNLDNFTAQFYGYTQNNGLTTVTFGLNGFTEALDAYNTKCK